MILGNLFVEFDAPHSATPETRVLSMATQSVIFMKALGEIAETPDRDARAMQLLGQFIREMLQLMPSYEQASEELGEVATRLGVRMKETYEMGVTVQ